MNAIIGRKIGMTCVYADDGRAIPVTVIEAGPCPVVQIRSHKDGRQGVQLGFGMKKPKRTTKAEAGHVKVSGLEAAPARLQEFPLPESAEAPKAGDVVTVNIFQAGDHVKIAGTTIGKGFQGVVCL